MKGVPQSYNMMSRRRAARIDAPRERRIMNIDDMDLSPELREKARACKTPEEMLALAKAEGYKLSEEELSAVSGVPDGRRTSNFATHSFKQRSS